MKKLGKILSISIMFIVLSVFVCADNWFGSVTLFGTQADDETSVESFDFSDDTSLGLAAYFNQNPPPYSDPSYWMTPGPVFEGNVYFKVDGYPIDQSQQQTGVDNGINCPMCDETTHWLNLTVTDADGDGYAKGFDDYTGDDKDCNDIPEPEGCGANCNPGILTETDCTDTYDNDCDGDIDLDDSDCDIYTDRDGDGIEDDEDNCVNDANPGQEDGDGDDIGDVCDNCAAVSNADQADVDADDIGDACDECPNDSDNDIDNDGICGDVDSCPNDPDNDADEDGICGDVDNIWGKSIDVDVSGMDNLGFSVNDVNDPDNHVGTNLTSVRFYDSDNTSRTIIEFDYNFSDSTLNLTTITINVTNSSGKGAIIITGLNLQDGQTKTVYMDNIASSGKICIKDEDNLASVSELINLACNGANEYLVNCPGKNGNYICTDLGDTYKIEGLIHSGVVESTYTATAPTTTTGGGGGGGGGCTELWSCTAWSACSEDETQTRTCTDENNCGKTSTKPDEEQSCTYILPEVAVKVEEKPIEEETIPPEEILSEKEIEPNRGAFAAITGAVIGAVTGETGIGILIIVIIVAGGLFLFFYLNKRAKRPNKAGKKGISNALNKKEQTLQEEEEKKSS